MKMFYFNLKLVQLQLVDKLAHIPQPFYTKWMQSAKKILSIDNWARLGLIFMFLFFTFKYWFFSV